MRRSLREATVGLSILAALVIASGLWLHLRGSRFFGSAWAITVRLGDAAGLVSRSNVFYRGVDVGTVQSITPEPGFVAVQVQISDAGLVIAQPVRARVVSGSLLGGTAQLVLIGSSRPLDDPVSPTAEDCPSAQQLCAGAVLLGAQSPSLDTAVASTTDLLDQVIDLDLVGTINETVKVLADTSNTITVAAEESIVLIQSIQDLVQQLEPTVDHLNISAADVNTITGNLAKASAELSRPETIATFRQTMANVETAADQLSAKAGPILANMESFTAKLDEISSDVLDITGDAAVAEGLRNLTVGLGLFFEDLYGAERLADPKTVEEGAET
ncbi:MlaD family protein [Candidatus Synechococcus spongiarum]|uniref:Mce/MlaD domain-containing protein n=1 Tax=Candidatus Synechococcus spongiarum TaxID=431041 RepID=A0A170T5G7_9SYNE|nr:MlaD family protein [Candidatus Synechococcus spongiarum]CZB13286.1 hypothetical protein FLM9_310 [Candidatus Synechococcus spongiarum]